MQESIPGRATVGREALRQSVPRGAAGRRRARAHGTVGRMEQSEMKGARDFEFCRALSRQEKSGGLSAKELLYLT